MTTTRPQKTVVTAISGYFNEGAGKRPNSEFLKELRDLSPEEKQMLAEGACEVMGWDLKK